MTGKTKFSVWITSIAALAAVPLVLFVLIYLIDYYWIGARTGDIGALRLFYHMSVEDARQVMGGMGEVIVASIIVQLAATRYTPRISEMFFKDRTNLVVLAFFVVSAVFCLWVNYVIRGGGQQPTFIPVVGAIANVLMLSISVLLIAPYFLYVFDFLEPGNIVKGIKNQAVDKFRNIKDPSHVQAVQGNTIVSVEQLADIAMNAVEQKDKGLATSSVDSLLDMLKDYLAEKRNIPEEFFKVTHRVKSNPDFISMHSEVLQEISKKRTWLD